MSRIQLEGLTRRFDSVTAVDDVWLDIAEIRDGMMEAVENVVYQGSDAESTLRAKQDEVGKLLPDGGK